MTDTPTIFISYSHRDEKPWKELIEGHLRVAERQGVFALWEDRQIGGGDDWRGKIDTALETADIAVLLISRHFLTSNFIMNHEVNTLLERKERDGLRLYPILIGSCDWKTVGWLERLNLRPIDGKALASFRGDARDQVATAMATEIRDLLRQDRENARQRAELQAETTQLGEKLGVTENAVRSFLSILDERHVSGADLQDKLKEIAEQHIEMQTRLAALDQDDPVIREWIEEAKAAIAAGDYDEADKRLTEAEARDLSAARQAAAQADQRFLNAAATRALRGETSLTRLRYLEAAEHFAESAKLVPANKDEIRAGYLAQQGRALDRGNRTLAAIEAYEEATALDPDRTSSWILLGRLHERAGNLAATESAQLQARDVAARHGRDRDQAVATHEIGDVRLAQGNLTGAIQAFQEFQDVAKRLAADDPGNAEWQRDLSVSHERIGNVRVAQGDLDGALLAYQAGLGIAERLAAADPGNAAWQRDLSVSHWRLADLAESRYVSEEALDHWRAALTIAVELEQSGRLAPTDSYFVETIQGRIDALITPAAGTDG